jgi:prepilin-type N-terminal cleavage/methylation domain-containing protein
MLSRQGSRSSEDRRTVPATRSRARAEGFTLVELLIVIAIIGLLSALVTGAVAKVKDQAKVTETKSAITTFGNALAVFFSDKSYYPGYDVKTDEDELEEFNAFPVLFTTLYSGKKNYIDDINYKSLVIMDYDTDTYVEALTDDIEDKDVEKFYLDSYGAPIYYRENKQKKPQDWMIKKSSFDLWSIGPNGINEACYGLDATKEAGYDDITN